MSIEVQAQVELLEGKISYLTSNNIYVKFQNTRNIKIGDTLSVQTNGVLNSCLRVIKKSSTSCVCQRIGDCQPELDQSAYFQQNQTIINLPGQEEKIDEVIEDEPGGEVLPVVEKPIPVEKISKFRARLSTASYSHLPSNAENRHRQMYRFSMNAMNIQNSKFSIESYINYRQNITEQSASANFLRVYNMAVKYDIDSTFNLTIGRKINRKASSLGAIDGLQGEKLIGDFYIGGIVGFKPDIFEFDFNPNLFEFGAYIGLKKSNKTIYSQSTFGLLEQRNLGQIDRRYAYFQHSITINRKLSLFSSFEVDLYTMNNGEASSDFRLTNLYLSARYRLNRKINFSISYDSRKRIIYYETLRTDIERLLADDEARQGIRARINIKPFKYVNTGVSYSKRFQSDRQNQSENINGFLSISKLPIGGRMTLNYNNNHSIYLKSNIIAFRYSRPLGKKVNSDFYYRNVQYKYLTSEVNVQQNYFGTGITFRLSRQWMFSILGELSTRENENNYRVNTKIIRRFRN